MKLHENFLIKFRDDNPGISPEVVAGAELSNIRLDSGEPGRSWWFAEVVLGDIYLLCQHGLYGFFPEREGKIADFGYALAPWHWANFPFQ